MKVRTNTVYILLVLSVLLAIASTFITYFNTVEKEQSTQTVIRRYQSIASSTQLFSLLKDMEAGQRGYILTGDSEFLEPYNQAKGIVETQMDSLNKLLSDNERQTNLLKGKIMTVVNNKRADLEHTIHLANIYGKDSAARKVNTKIGKAHMDTLRILIGDLIQREQTLLANQNEKLEEHTRMEDNVRFFAFALIGMTSLVALVSLVRKQENINILVENLQSANETLEHKVTERTQELVKVNEAKDHFLGIASHDLKVPIAGVLGLIGLMKRENSERSKRDVEYLSYMEDSCNSMQGLIANLLDINRIERGEAIVRIETLDLNVLVAKLKNEFSHQAEKKGITLIISPVTGSIQTDPETLLRILENLLSNAIKFSRNGKTVQLNTVLRDGNTSFEIIDQGPGISPEEIPDLFKKFQKLSNKPTGGEGSTGLGLSIVKELTILLGGEIKVTSQLNQGSVFTVTLPQG